HVVGFRVSAQRVSSARRFFFQAEDGIRDFHVTGVQTCALPISPPRGSRAARAYRATAPGRRARPALRELGLRTRLALAVARPPRSEERRAGRGGGARRGEHPPGGARRTAPPHGGAEGRMGAPAG